MLMLTKICVTVLGSGLRLVGMLWEGLSLSAGQFWFKKWKGIGFLDSKWIVLRVFCDKARWG